MIDKISESFRDQALSGEMKRRRREMLTIVWAGKMGTAFCR